MELYVLAHQRDGHFAFRVLERPTSSSQSCNLGARMGSCRASQTLSANFCPFQHQRHLIERFGVEVLDDEFGGDVAKQRELFAHFRRDGIIAAADEHAGMDAHALQFLDGVLRGLGLEFLRGLQIRDEGDVDKQRALRGHFPLELADGLDEGLTLDVADRSADLGDDDIGLFADAVELFLDLIGDMGDDLHGAAVVAAFALAP